MDNKIYYGEYTLSHWIDLILKKNIRLPAYQRNFVWKEEKVRELINALTNKEFIPPVIIGSYKDGASTHNLILDGQQRLTSILLAYLGIMPDIKTFKAKHAEQTMANMAEGDEVEEYVSNLDDILDWTFDKLTKKGHNKEMILSEIIHGNYKDLHLQLSDDFFDTRYLGFSFVVPQDDNSVNQQKFYSTVFRNINIKGTILQPQESREALYYFNNGMPEFFKPDFCKEIELKIPSSSIETPLDFVRYMSLLSQYHKDRTTNYLARGFRSDMEKYYENYVFSVLKERSNPTYGDFDTLFPNEGYKPRMEKLAEAILQLNLSGKGPFPSIIDMDTWVFGLAYQVMFEKKRLDPALIDDLTAAVNAKIAAYKSDPYHQRSPNAFKYMRPRVEESINLYSEYVITE